MLVVDDNQSTRSLLKEMLADIYEILEAENGKVALDIFETVQGKIGAILLDLNMPVMDGCEFLEKRRKNPNMSSVPVIVLTGQASEQFESKALKLGADDFLRKPGEPDIIKLRIRNLIRLRQEVRNRKAATAFMDNLPGGVAIYEIGDDIRLIYFNEGLARMSGYNTAEYDRRLKEDCFTSVFPDDITALKAHFKKRAPINQIWTSSTGHISVTELWVGQD